MDTIDVIYFDWMDTKNKANEKLSLEDIINLLKNNDLMLFESNGTILVSHDCKGKKFRCR